MQWNYQHCFFPFVFNNIPLTTVQFLFSIWFPVVFHEISYDFLLLYLCLRETFLPKLLFLLNLPDLKIGQEQLHTLNMILLSMLRHPLRITLQHLKINIVLLILLNHNSWFLVLWKEFPKQDIPKFNFV